MTVLFIVVFVVAVFYTFMATINILDLRVEQKVEEAKCNKAVLWSCCNV
jgi:NADH:ubiquinone oxidoreductase subunit 6 (subunit J)